MSDKNLSAYFYKSIVNQEIETNLKNKGYYLYRYVDINELLSTVQRDYLKILSYINIPLIIISIIIGLIFLPAFFIFLATVYIGIFVYLFGVLLYRTYYFFMITNIVYTNKGIVIGDEIIYYKDHNKLSAKLDKYEAMFDEYLSRPSKINERINLFKSKIWFLFGKPKAKHISKKSSSNSFELGDFGMPNFDIGDFGDAGKVIGIIIIVILVYIVSLNLFYYLGFAFGYLLVLLYALLIKLILYFRNSIELRINDNIQSIDKYILQMNDIYTIIDNKISEFIGGIIYKKFSDKIDKNFSIFYVYIQNIFKNQKKLYEIINSSVYKNIFDFELFNKYMQNYYNKPVQKMIILIDQKNNEISEQIKKLSYLKNSYLEKDFEGNLKLKEIELQQLQKNLSKNKIKLQASLLK